MQGPRVKRTGAEPREKDIRQPAEPARELSFDSSSALRLSHLHPLRRFCPPLDCFTPAVCVPHSTRTPPSYLFIPFHSMFSSFIYSSFPALLMLSSFASHDPPFCFKWSFSAPFTLPGPAGPWSAEHRQPISIAPHGWTPSTKEQRGKTGPHPPAERTFGGGGAVIN